MCEESVFEEKLRDRRSQYQTEAVDLTEQIGRLQLRRLAIRQCVTAINLLLGEPEVPVCDGPIGAMTIVEACRAAMIQSGRPMKAGELAIILNAAGLRQKTRTPARSITVLLDRSPLFAKVDRGTYALVAGR
jgi:hypothetical protein